MKNLNIIYKIIIIFLVAISCELDNYDWPDATFYGTILDYETNEAVQQDIRAGSVIDYIEHGFENPEVQYMVIKNDGTFRNTMMFSGTYTMILTRGNCVPTDSVVVEISPGENKSDFVVQPYIRIIDVSIEKSGDKIVASLKLDQTVTNKVKRIGLYAHPEPTVGEPINIVKSEKNINAVTNSETVYTLEIDLIANSNLLIAGKQYYFRVGALIDIGQAKYNYAPAVRIGV